MIAPEKAREIRQLLAEGELSQRQIARETGISRETVAGIASGRRPDDDDPIRPAEPPERCPGCGNTVYMPCRRCLAENAKAVQRRRLDIQHPQESEGPPTLGVNVKGKQRVRYEAARAGRIQEADDEHRDQLGPALLPDKPLGLNNGLCQVDLQKLLDAFEFDEEPVLHGAIQNELRELQQR